MKTRYEELYDRIKGRVKVGQQLIVAPYNAPDIKEADMVLERGIVVLIPDTGPEITIEMESGDKRTVHLEIGVREYLLYGTIEISDGELLWVFLTEQDFWNWWEWYITAAWVCAAFIRVDLEGASTRQNLGICRLLCDILVNKNLAYQNRRCDGCKYAPEMGRVKQKPCGHCVREKTKADLWEGLTSRRAWLMRGGEEVEPNRDP